MENASAKGDSKTLFKTINYITGNKKSSPYNSMKDNDGTVLKTPQKRLDGWKDHFEDLYNRPDPTMVENFQNTEFPPENANISTEVPSLEEVKSAIKKLKSGKSPGPCNIPAEVLQALNQSSLQYLTDLFQIIWSKKKVPKDFRDSLIVPIFKKGSKSDFSNYRGISLLSIAGKVLTSIIRLRLLEHYESSIRRQQAGFRRGRGCIDQIFSLRQCIERQLRYGKSSIITFIDFAAAFDSIHRDSMWKILRSCSIPQHRLVDGALRKCYILC